MHTAAMDQLTRGALYPMMRKWSRKWMRCMAPMKTLARSWSGVLMWIYTSCQNTNYVIEFVRQKHTHTHTVFPPFLLVEVVI
jgi:hypothetical protein